VYGEAVAFLAEAGISFVLMLTVLFVSNAPWLARYTGLFAGLLVAACITFEAPLSGMSMNPARTFASGLPSSEWRGVWVYFTAPLIGMLAAAQAYLCVRGDARVRCAKLHHDNAYRCIFCEFQSEQRQSEHL
jgi:aquaporin Z